MSKDKIEENRKLFFPYYINQGRLLDIYAILNDGYSEYSEITTAIGSEKQKSGNVAVSASHGFKLINFGVNGNLEGKQSDSSNNENKEKKIQTVTSILSIVMNTLENRGYLVDIMSAKPGNFVCIPVVLAVNSIKSLLSEMSDLLKLTEAMNDLQTGTENKKDAAESKKAANAEKALKAMKVLFGGEEILYTCDKYAIVGSIVDSNLYQAERADIIGSELMCLAQVKRVFPKGTELMKNTTFSKIRNETAKNNAVNAIRQISQGDFFDFEAVAVTEIKDKPVYQLEIIALYQ